MDAIEKILKIQREYLELLESYFKDERKELGTEEKQTEFYADRLYSRKKASLVVPYQGQNVSSAEYMMISLIRDVKKFWNANKSELATALKESGLLFLDISGEPEDIKYYVRKYAIYFDTLCVACPLSSISEEYLILKLRHEKRKYNFAFSFGRYIHTCNAIRNILLKTYPPVFLIFPSEYFLVPSENAAVLAMRKQSSNERLQLFTERFYFHVQRLFEEVFQREFDFEGSLEAREFLSTIKVGDINREGMARFLQLVDPESLPFRGRMARILHRDRGTNVYRQIETLARGVLEPPEISTETLLFLWDSLMVKLLCTETIYLDSCFYSMDSYFFDDQKALYQWKLSNEAKEIRRALNLSEAEVAAYTIGTKLKWLSRLPLEAVIEIRRENGLVEIRQLFRDSAKRIGSVRADQLEEVSKEIEMSILEKIAKFHSSLASERKDLVKRLGISSGLLLGSCALGIAAIAFPLIAPLAITSTVFTVVFGGKSILGLYKDYRAGKLRFREFKRSPIAIFAEFPDDS